MIKENSCSFKNGLSGSFDCSLNTSCYFWNLYPKLNDIVGNWLQIDCLISSMLEGNRFPMYNRECIMQERLIIRIITRFLSEGMISQHLHSIFDNVGDQHFSFRVGWLSIRLKYVCFYNFDKTSGIWQNDTELYVLKFIWSFYTKIVWDYNFLRSIPRGKIGQDTVCRLFGRGFLIVNVIYFKCQLYFQQLCRHWVLSNTLVFTRTHMKLLTNCLTLKVKICRQDQQKNSKPRGTVDSFYSSCEILYYFFPIFCL